MLATYPPCSWEKFHKITHKLFPMKPLPQPPLGGRLRHLTDQWEKLTHDQSIINSVKGWEIPLLSNPKGKINLKPYPMSQEEKNLVSIEVASMLEKGAI